MASSQLDEKSIFSIARKIESPEARSVYLKDACGDDPALLDRLAALLRVHDEEQGFLESPPPGLVATLDMPPIAERPGQTIGHYKLLEEIAEGGMGVVYMAEQQEPVRRKVALKIIKPGMDTREVIARFEAERQALALMDHPNIAKVFDAGATDSGRPYFVMELVHGIPLTDYCDQDGLTTRERLELFVQVCQAVQHAHQKGAIHRDLKPSNVMVTLYDGVPVPKIIDFGIAKATNRQLAERTVFTSCGQMIGTPLYMSPEQAEMSGLDVDTRSDIYSLGVLLYELLTGSTPFDQERVQKAGYDEIRRMIREDEPPRPSTRISTLGAAATTVSAYRKTDPAKLSGLLRRDLDWIVMKALEKDRTRRYQTANDFARDIQRYLNDEPIEARPPTLFDRAAKWARRHRPIVWSAAAALVFGVVALAVSSVLIAGAYEGERDARQLADQQRRIAEEQEALAKKQHGLAEKQRDAAEYDLHVSNMRLAQSDWATGHMTRLRDLLDAQVPKPGRPDFRGWEWYYLFSQCHCERFALPLQQTSGFVWSPDGESLATVDHLGLVNIWSAANGQCRASLKGLPGHSPWLSWSPDGKHLAAASDRGVVVIWDVASGEKARSLYGHVGAVHCVDWNRDSVRLASAGEDATIRIWDSRTGKTIASLDTPSGPVWCCDWHPDGKQLLAVFGPFNAYQLKIWDTASGKALAGWDTDWGNWAVFNPDGSRVAWFTPEAFVKDLKTGENVFSYRQNLRFAPAWSPTGDRLAAAAYGGTIKIFDARNGAELSSSAFGVLPEAPVAWSPKGTLLASSGSDKTVKVWEIAAGSKARRFFTAPSGALSARFSPDGKRLLVSAEHSFLKVVDVESGKETLSLTPDPAWWVRHVAWSPDGKRFAVLAGEGVLVSDAATGKPSLPILQCDGDNAWSLAWSPDGEVLAVGTFKRRFGQNRGRVKLFDAKTGKELAASPYTDDGCESVAWRPDGKRLAAIRDVMCVFDTALHEQFRTPAADSFSLDWSPDGKYLAVGFFGGEIAIYDAATGTPIHILEGWQGVNAVRWHPFMPRLATGAGDGTIRIWDTSTGNEIVSLEAHAGSVDDLDWSPDGLRLASASSDHTVRVWDASIADQFFKRHGDLRAQAYALVQKEDYQEALDLLQRLRTLHPEEKELETQIRQVQWLRATHIARQGQLDQSIAIFRRLGAEAPDLPDYRLRLPGAMFEAGKEATAIEMLEKWVAEFPQTREYRDELGFLYERWATKLCQSGQFEKALPLLRKVAKEFPERPDFRAHVAFEMAKADRLEETIAAFAKIAEAPSHWPDYRPQLARRLEGVGEPGAAALIYRQLLADYPQVPEYRSALARCLTATGRREEAEAILKQSPPAQKPKPAPAEKKKAKQSGKPKAES